VLYFVRKASQKRGMPPVTGWRVRNTNNDLRGKGPTRHVCKKLGGQRLKNLKKKKKHQQKAG